MWSPKSSSPNGALRPPPSASSSCHGGRTRLWLLAGIAGALFLLALVPVWDVWTVNHAGILVNRAIVGESSERGPSTPGDKSGRDDKGSRTAAERAMALMEAAAARGPQTAEHEIPIWRTYGAAASIAPSNRAFELLLHSRNAGRLDRLGELWLGEVASAVWRWDIAAEAYGRIDASNLLIHQADLSLEAGDKELAAQQYALALQSLEAAIERDAAEELLLTQGGGQSTGIGESLRPRADRITSLYRIGRGLIWAGRPRDAVPVLESAIDGAETASPGAVIEQSLSLNLALALARTLPDPPLKQSTTVPNSYSYYADPELMAYVRAFTRIRALVYSAISSDRTAPTNVQAARVLLLTGDDTQAVSLYEEAIKLDSRMAEAYLGLGAWYEGRGRRILAREVYAEGSRQLPADPQIAAAYGITAHKTLPAITALPLLERAAQTGSRDPYLFAHLGDCYSELGFIDQARAAYEEGLRRAPAAGSLRERLAALQRSASGSP